MGVDPRVVREGAIAGLVGAAAVAAWFLLVDLADGAPFQTPTVLWAVLFRGVRDASALTVGVGPVVAYTIVHCLAFVLFGIAAALLLGGAEREPAMLLALLIFFAAFEVFFLALVAFLARPVLQVVAWWKIPIGNLLAAVSMAAYLFLAHRALARTLLGRWVDVIREGVGAGLTGGAVVTVWFLFYDTLFRAPFRTPALLGAAAFREALSDPLQTQVSQADLELILGYTVLHFAAFAAFGILAAVLLLAAEREPRILLGLFILFWCVELFFLGFIAAIDARLAGELGWWNIAVADLLAAASMLVYFFLGHRALGARLMERWTED